MCGIVGCMGCPNGTLETLMDGLGNLEYRGYDSAGVALGPVLETRKRAGELDELRKTVAEEPPTGDFGVGHTRWSTHGPPADRNAHPHTDESGRVAVVHNGIIENYQRIRDELEAEGVTFTSETDTEVVPHLIARELESGSDATNGDGGCSPADAFHAVVDRLEGSYALCVVVDGHEAIFAARQGSPLVMGVDERATYLASDVPAFIERTRDVVFLEDGQRVELRPDDWTVMDADRSPVEVSVETVEYTAEATGKSGYDHYMLKEINEQPDALRQCLSGRLDELDGTIEIEELSDLEEPTSVQIVACGTSYHAAVYAATLLRGAGVPAAAHLASEYATAPAPLGKGTLVIGVTQSGETADTLAALREARARGARTLAVTNQVNSTAARECDDVVYIRAGPEIGVAATKTFSSQLMATLLLTEDLVGLAEDLDPLIEALRDLPGAIQTVLDTTDAREVAAEIADSDAYFFIGRDRQFPVALEGALKCKEISYEHAEGFAAGELKHGPLALVTPATPVFAIVTGDGERARKTIGNIKEVEARDAPVVAVTDGRSEAERYADLVLEIPETHPLTAPVLTNVQLQLVSYHLANDLGRPIDKPRNLAKSVTVE
ncbi:glutamine--fructose-6-phosphate transaminase (isomerizing) [Halopenitus sp. H-Gu1]|uniref:glutamine--fructose-6-phosphate transaminase (isomerizing) n=1 Tax=Halopenitus sp. H-Gu1 TaxID=3242697 RepID=UPI00359CC2D5